MVLRCKLGMTKEITHTSLPCLAFTVWAKVLGQGHVLFSLSIHLTTLVRPDNTGCLCAPKPPHRTVDTMAMHDDELLL